MARASLKDVAKAAGVSHMTVSRVVRGERTVKAATVEKIRRFIRKLGYSPDPALSALAAYRSRGRSHSAGHVLAFLEMERTPYVERVRQGAADEAARLGYAVQVFPLPSTEAGQRQLNRQLFHRGIRGLLISPAQQPRRLEGWDWSHFAPVSMGALRHEPMLHAVAMDYFNNLQTAYAGMRKLGYRRIGLLLNEEMEARTGHLWLGAYLSIRSPAMAPLLFRCAPDLERQLRRWLRRERPDAVLVIDSQWHEMLAKAGVASAYLNDIAQHPAAPMIRFDPRLIGSESVQLVHVLLQRRELGLPALPKMVLLRGAWDESGLAEQRF